MIYENLFRRSTRVVMENECSCGNAPLDLKFICPKCNGTNTRLRDGYDSNDLFCRDCKEETAKDKHWYNYRRSCIKCGCKAGGGHFTRFGRSAPIERRTYQGGY